MFLLPILITQYNKIFPHLVRVPPNNKNTDMQIKCNVSILCSTHTHTLKHLDSWQPAGSEVVAVLTNSTTERNSQRTRITYALRVLTLTLLTWRIW